MKCPTRSVLVFIRKVPWHWSLWRYVQEIYFLGDFWNRAKQSCAWPAAVLVRVPLLERSLTKWTPVALPKNASRILLETILQNNFLKYLRKGAGMKQKTDSSVTRSNFFSLRATNSLYILKIAVLTWKTDFIKSFHILTTVLNRLPSSGIWAMMSGELKMGSK